MYGTDIFTALPPPHDAPVEYMPGDIMLVPGEYMPGDIMLVPGEYMPGDIMLVPGEYMPGDMRDVCVPVTYPGDVA